MPLNLSAFQVLYQGFSLPLSEIDCGQKCGPHNEYGVPVCCDIGLLIPTAFKTEWEYLQENTDLWHQWEGISTPEGKKILLEMQPEQVALQCLGHQQCQRHYRTITCRSFPFYPYLNDTGSFIGLAYFHEYREQCWILSNLSLVTLEYKQQFQNTYNRIFGLYREIRKVFQEFSSYMRTVAISEDDKLILLKFDGRVFSIKASNEITKELSYTDLETYGPFKTMKEFVFPDEIEGMESGEID